MTDNIIPIRPSGIADYERRKLEIRSMINEEVQRHRSTLAALAHEYAEAEEAVRMLSTGIDGTKVLLAEHVINVRGTYAKAGSERVQALETAVQELLKGGGRLFQQYFGTKDYDGWHGQFDYHPYGFGPRHGSIIFAIGLQQTVLQHNKVLDEEQIEAAIYYLRNIERIQAAKDGAKAAAAQLGAA